MLRFLSYFTQKKSFLLFVFLELIALLLIVDKHNYSKVKQHSFNTALSGFVNQKLGVISYHLNLEKANQKLMQQNANLLSNAGNGLSKLSGSLPDQFSVIPAVVISNQHQFKNNTVILNKGTKDGVLPEMGIMGTNGIIGITQNISAHFTQGISILNTQSKISVSLKNTNHTGFLRWDGNNPNTFLVGDMPLNAHVSIGDTIVTSGVSNIFPKGIPVGKITDFRELSDRKSYEIVLTTFMDMTNLSVAYIIKNKFKKEFDSINGH